MHLCPLHWNSLCATSYGQKVPCTMRPCAMLPTMLATSFTQLTYSGSNQDNPCGWLSQFLPSLLPLHSSISSCLIPILLFLESTGINLQDSQVEPFGDNTMLSMGDRNEIMLPLLWSYYPIIDAAIFPSEQLSSTDTCGMQRCALLTFSLILTLACLLASHICHWTYSVSWNLFFLTPRSVVLCLMGCQMLDVLSCFSS